MLTDLNILLMLCWLFVSFRFMVTLWMLIFQFKQFISSKYFFSQLYSSKDGKFVSLAELSEFFRNFFINIFKKKPKLFAVLIDLSLLFSGNAVACCFDELQRNNLLFFRETFLKRKRKFRFFFQIRPKLCVDASTRP